MTTSKELRVKLVPYPQKDELLPEQIQWFFANKLYHTVSEGGFIWKAGEYSWVGGVNSEVKFENEPEVQAAIAKGLMLDYTLIGTTLENGEFKIEKMVDNTTNRAISRDTVFEGAFPVKHNSELDEAIYKLFATNFICEDYLDYDVGIPQAIELLTQLGEEAMLESQKLLFVGLQKLPELEIKTKEDIYPLLQEFVDHGFPKVCEIYACRVDKVKNGVALVKMTSSGPENVVRAEKFLVEQFFKGAAEKNCQFDFTVYTRDGTRSQTQPI
jgi:hypothetical protein